MFTQADKRIDTGEIGLLLIGGPLSCAMSLFSRADDFMTGELVHLVQNESP